MFYPVVGKVQSNMKKSMKHGQESNIVANSEKEDLMPMWVPNMVIRRRKGDEIALVIHVYNNCTMVVDLNDKNPMVTPRAILLREYPNWARDCDGEDVNDEWHYKRVNI